ncbi:MAG: IS21 family transposase [Chitinophagaceae bacterium]
MSKKLIEMKVVRKMILLLQRGLSERQIARELKIARATVNRYKERLASCPKSLEELLNMDDAVLAEIAHFPFRNVQQNTRNAFIVNRREYYFAELQRPGVTRMLLWQEYIREHPEGYQYSKFCELLAELMLPQQASFHVQYEPAAMMMVDFAGDKISYIDRSTGALVECCVFVSILPYSGYSYAIALANETMPSVIKALNASLAYFGGAPFSIKCDNMRTAVIKSCRYEPIFTEVFEQWALHNNMALFAARPYKPKDKAPVEKEVLLTYQRLYAPLRDTEFFSLEQINAAFQKQLELHHQADFQKKAISRLEQFLELEKGLLQPLPSTPFVIRYKAECKVKMDYHITLCEDGHHYSVPCKYIGKKVAVNYDTDTVEVFFELNRIAMHRRSYKKGGFTTVIEHMPIHHQKVAEQNGWDQDYFLGQAAKIGTHTHQYVGKVLKSRPVIQQAFNACKGILRLGHKYGPERLEAACKRGLNGDRYNYSTLDNILKNHLDKLITDEQPELFRMPDHPNVRGGDAYQ